MGRSPKTRGPSPPPRAMARMGLMRAMRGRWLEAWQGGRVDKGADLYPFSSQSHTRP